MKNASPNLGILILRLSLGILMLLHGIAKINKGISGIKGIVASAGLPEFIGYGVYIGEIVAPILIIIGLRTKIGAMIFAINLLVALFLVHYKDIFQITKTGGWGVELIGLYLFGSIALIFTGGGRFSVSSSNRWD